MNITRFDVRFAKSMKIDLGEEPQLTEKQKRTPYEWVHILRGMLQEANIVNLALDRDLEEASIANGMLQETQNRLIEQRDHYHQQRDYLHRNVLILLTAVIFMAAGIVGYGIWRWIG